MECGLRGTAICAMDGGMAGGRCWRAMDGRCRARSRLWSAWVGAALFAASPSALAAPDVELGRYLSAECVTCHGAASGTPGSTIPNIYGRPEQALAEAVKAFRDKTRASAVMQSVAGRLKDDEIEALAAYFASTRRPQ
jgi:cytochrome c553